jgi:hercynylcysteine S-oxide lyase
LAGSYGTFPRAVRDAQRGFQEECEERVDRFMKFAFVDHLDRSRLAISKVLNAPLEGLTFVPNASTGVATVLYNLEFEPDEHIIYFETIYEACGNMVAYKTETTPAKATRIKYDYPVSDDWLVQTLVDTIARIRSAGERVKVVIFDTVASQPGVRMPFERLAQVCKDEGVLSLVDGAHGVGHVELDLTKLDPDFFVSNCHK